MTDSKTFTVTVNDPGVDASYETGFNVALETSSEGPTYGIFQSIGDPPGGTIAMTEINGDSFTAGSPLTLPSGATLSMASDGNFTYTPALNFSGTDSFSYAADAGGATASGTVTIVVMPAPVAQNDTYRVNFDAELVTSGNGVLANDLGPNSVALTVTKVDGDDFTPGSAITLASGASLTMEGGGEFTYVPSSTGSATSDSFDYTVKDTYGGKATGTATITINRAPTDIALSSASIAENQDGGTVGSLSATDPNAGDTFTFALVAGSGGDDNGLFSIDGNVLLANQSFDYETASSYSIRVQATDQDGLSYEKVFAIGILDANDAPTDIELSGTAVDESQPAGTLVGDLSALDQDSGETFWYALVDGEGGDDNASFYISGGQLFTAGRFDYELQSSYSVRVEAMDSGGWTYEKSFTIAVNDLEEPGASISLTSAANPAQLHQSGNIDATVTAGPEEAVAPTGTVSFYDGGGFLGTVQLVGGVASLPLASLGVGTHEIIAFYSGDTNFAATPGDQPATLTQTINENATSVSLSSTPNPSQYTAPVTFTASVSVVGGGLSGTPSGSVYFYAGGGLIGSAELVDGVASLAIDWLGAGEHSITAVYGGDETYAGSESAALAQTVNENTTSVSLASSLNPAQYSSEVVFTATVTIAGGLSGTPSGSVYFYADGGFIGSAELVDGVATLALDWLGVGAHSITAVYGGDATYAGSESAALTQTVNANETSTTVSASASTSQENQPVTFTATVVPIGGALSGTPGGTVYFYASGGYIGSAELVDGVATLQIDTLAAGAYTIVALYLGDVMYAGSESDELGHVVSG